MTRCVALAWALLIGACGGGQSALPACTQAAGLDPDAGPGACSAGRTLLDCTLSNGGGVMCLSDDGAQCPNPAADTTIGSCANRCGDEEYGVACGGPPSPGVTYQPPPSGCRSAAVTPGGVEFYCCPCL